jgi:hypothetical protein
MNLEERFAGIVSSGTWGSEETPCGPGSTIEACRAILKALPEWIGKHGIRSIADAGCGDFHWMSQIDLAGIEYDGYDIVKELILENRRRHSKPNVRFHHVDILIPLPAVDLVLCKDVLGHLPTDLALAALRSIFASGSRFLAATTHVGWQAGYRVGMTVGGFSPLDLEQFPFSMESPLEAVDVPARPGNPRKLFALWRLGGRP